MADYPPEIRSAAADAMFALNIHGSAFRGLDTRQEAQAIAAAVLDAMSAKGAEPQWRAGRPPAHGYYLGAWRRGARWTVSELWFNPDSIGTGWWSSRGYLGGCPCPETVPVEAWMPVPGYPAAPGDGDG